MDTNETTIEPLEGADAPRFDNAPIGVFDSGFGGLTVAREIAKELPRESIVYLGDSARCPYGPRSLDEVCRGARRVVVIDGVVDTTNIGAIFRSAAALGMDAVLLTPSSCDPLNRRAVRVSMGSVFLVPWTWLDGSPSELHRLGFRTAAMALTDNSISLDDPRLAAEQRLAIVMGTEGDGLSREAIAEADYVVRIPMAHGVDSLNVAAASAVAFWQLRVTDR